MSGMPGTPGAVGMSKGQAKKLAILAPLTAATLAFVASLSTKGSLPDLRVVFGAGLAAVLLSIFAELNASLAGGFAVLLMVTALLVVGGEAWTGLAKLVGANTTPVTKGANVGAVLGSAPSTVRKDQP